MRNEILRLAKDTLEFLEQECNTRQLSDDVIDSVLEVILAAKPPLAIFCNPTD